MAFKIKRHVPALLFALCYLPFAMPLHAASGTESASFLDIPVGAGPAALGGAYSALATDAYAPVWNPGGLGFVTSPQIAGQHLSYLESINYEFLSFVYPLSSGERQRGSIGFSAQYLGSGDIPGMSLEGNPEPDYSTHYAAYSLAYGHAFGKWSLGVTGKWLNAKISDVSSDAFAADLGALYKVNDKLNLAGGIRNLGSTLKFLDDASSLPLAARLGAAYQPIRHWTIAVEGEYPKTGEINGHVGLEWKPLGMVAIRAGYRTDTTKELDALAGFSTGLGLTVWGQEFAYAWLPYGDLGDTQYFSLLIRFGKSAEEKKSLIRAQDIKRHKEPKEAIDTETQQLIELLNGPDEKAAQKAGHSQKKLTP